MGKLVLANRLQQIVEFDMSTHKIILRLGKEVNQIIISNEGGELVFRSVPSDPSWAANVGIVAEWLKRYGAVS